MKITIQLTEQEKEEAYIKFIRERGIIPEDMKIEHVFISLGEIKATDEFEDEKEEHD